MGASVMTVGPRVATVDLWGSLSFDAGEVKRMIAEAGDEEH